ncbi:MAG: hypothetical protein JNK05_24880 [Myxococcales bacterium]|nr:hypothetical protein [Myxococcales bacterium]
MNLDCRTAVACILPLLAPTVALAQTTQQPDATIAPSQQPTQQRGASRNFVGANIMGVVGFLRLNAGSFGVSYEHIAAGRHGLRASFDFVHVHQASTELQTHQWSLGGSVAYRYYFMDAMGPFVGASVGYRRGWGHFEEPGRVAMVHLFNEHVRAMAHAGYRYVLAGRWPTFSFVPSLGVGYAYYNVELAPHSHHATADGAYVTRTARDQLAATPVIIDLELTFALAF